LPSSSLKVLALHERESRLHRGVDRSTAHLQSVIVASLLLVAEHLPRSPHLLVPYRVILGGVLAERAKVGLPQCSSVTLRIGTKRRIQFVCH
jgi:hypothetical protein